MRRVADKGAFPIQEPLRNREEVQYARNVLAMVFRDYIDKGEQLVMTIDVRIEKPTKKQRGGCFLWFEDMATHSGDTPEAMRIFCMKEFFSPVVSTARGEEIVSIRSFGDLAKDEVTRLMNMMEVFCAEEQIPLRPLREQ